LILTLVGRSRIEARGPLTRPKPPHLAHACDGSRPARKVTIAVSRVGAVSNRLQRSPVGYRCSAHCCLDGRFSRCRWSHCAGALRVSILDAASTICGGADDSSRSPEPSLAVTVRVPPVVRHRAGRNQESSSAVLAMRLRASIGDWEDWWRHPSQWGVVISRSGERDEGRGDSREDDSVVRVRVLMTAGSHLRDPRRGGRARRFPSPM
jgi:hypothetical protein